MIAAILLAAGRSHRFGKDKLLLPLPDGTPIILRSLQTLRDAVPRTIAVVPPDRPTLLRYLQDHEIESVTCNECDSGMGASLACGVRASASADGWLVALGDMPFLQSETIRKVAERLAQGASMVAASCDGARGHPVGFGREFGAALMQLAGDIGARQLLSQHAHRLDIIETSDPGVLRDIDYPADITTPTA